MWNIQILILIAGCIVSPGLAAETPPIAEVKGTLSMPVADAVSSLDPLTLWNRHLFKRVAILERIGLDSGEARR